MISQSKDLYVSDANKLTCNCDKKTWISLESIGTYSDPLQIGESQLKDKVFFPTFWCNRGGHASTISSTPSVTFPEEEQAVNSVNGCTTSSTTSASSPSSLESKEQETLDWAGLGSCPGRSWNPPACGIWQKRKIPAPAQPSTELGEPDVEW